MDFEDKCRFNHVLVDMRQRQSPDEGLIASKSTLKSVDLSKSELPSVDASPKENVVEAFYSKLRQRERDKEIGGPLKLKTHSSLE